MPLGTGVSDGEGLGVGLGVGTGVPLGEGLGVGVGVLLGEGLGVGVGVGDIVGVGVIHSNVQPLLYVCLELVAEKPLTVCNNVQFELSLLPEIVQDEGSLVEKSLAVAQLYPLKNLGFVKSIIIVDGTFPSNHLVLREPSVSLSGPSPPGLLPPGFVVVHPID